MGRPDSSLPLTFFKETPTLLEKSIKLFLDMQK